MFAYNFMVKYSNLIQIICTQLHVVKYSCLKQIIFKQINMNHRWDPNRTGVSSLDAAQGYTQDIYIFVGEEALNLLQEIQSWYFKQKQQSSIFHIKLATIIVDEPKAPFSLTTTPRCRGEWYSFPRIAPLYPWSVPYNGKC